MKKASTKPTSKNKAHSAAQDVWLSSGNVFADLELPDADELLVKANLAHKIAALIDMEKLTQSQAAARLGIDQPKVSALLHGRLRDFSTERLIRFLNALGQDVEIVVRPRPRNVSRRHHGIRVVAMPA